QALPAPPVLRRSLLLQLMPGSSGFELPPSDRQPVGRLSRNPGYGACTRTAVPDCQVQQSASRRSLKIHLRGFTRMTRIKQKQKSAKIRVDPWKRSELLLFLLLGRSFAFFLGLLLTFLDNFRFCRCRRSIRSRCFRSRHFFFLDADNVRDWLVRIGDELHLVAL